MLKSGPLPIYYQILQILRAQIAAGQHPKGSQLPTDEELIRTFGVSRHTVRTALQHLVSDGTIERRRGKGSFVTADPANYGHWTLRTVEDFVNEQFDVRRDLLFADRVNAIEHTEAALFFSAAGRTELYLIQVVREMEQGPHAVASMYVPADLGRQLPRELFSSTAVIKLLEDHCHIRPHRVRIVASAEAADVETARLLGTDPGNALLVFAQSFYTREGQPIQYAVTKYRPDRRRQVLELYRERRASGVDWAP